MINVVRADDGTKLDSEEMLTRAQWGYSFGAGGRDSYSYMINNESPWCYEWNNKLGVVYKAAKITAKGIEKEEVIRIRPTLRLVK